MIFVPPTLVARNQAEMTLLGVEAHGVLDGLLFTLTLRQRYVNPTPEVAEVTYTFPLARGAWLMGMFIELDGQRREGQVLPKRDAERRYETAIEAGDAPAMLEQTANGLYTLNLGNLKPGEEAVIEVRSAQLLRFEQGMVRLAIPTTIAPRYGDAHKDGGLPAHAGVETSVSAAYPLSLRLDVRGALAEAAVACHTHVVKRESGPEGLAFTLQGGFLDRDVVFTAEGLTELATTVVAPDGEGWVAIASVCPPLPAGLPAPRMLKLLVDCSGSMAGDSIQSAREALAQVVEELEDGTPFTLTCFGSATSHRVREPMQAGLEARKHVLGLVGGIQADMGGTEMDNALRAAMALTTPEEGADVLLVTDGEVWGDPAVNAKAVQTRHRIFAVGLGSAPNEERLRAQAEATGGACELVTPNEDVAAAIVRLFRRMRQDPTPVGKVKWPRKPAWELPAPRDLFGGETVHLVAGFKAPPVGEVSLAYGEDAQLVATLGAPAGEAGTRGTPARLAAGLRLAGMREKQAVALAVEYQLVSRHTHMIAVLEREAGQQTDGLPTLIKVSQMHAAGSHGVGGGMVNFAMASSVSRAYMSPSRDLMRRARFDEAFDDTMHRQAPSGPPSAPPPAPAAPAPGLLSRLSKRLFGGRGAPAPAAALAFLEATRDPEAVCAWLATTAIEDEVPALVVWVETLLAVGTPPEVARLVALYRWSLGPGCELSRHALRMVRAALAICPADSVAQAEALV